ncbi:MAG: hypothetical protein UZ22_OP11002000247 [Microgenomates bacterium OLB23]|nr:MAG: hypothetical protein UZ22_OP11002000247 [Microgenomates bacterium OLB23]
MRRRTAFDIIKQIHSEIEEQTVPIEAMVRDIQMMGFKIRPLVGDISIITKMHDEVVRSLWKVGKIDEIINNYMYELDEDDQDRLIDYLKKMEVEAENRIRDSLQKKKQNFLKNKLTQNRGL